MARTNKRSDVYFIPASYDESPEALSGKIEYLARESGVLDDIIGDDFVGIKLHFGEEENTGFIRPRLVKKLGDYCKARTDNVSLVETNTIYVGSRSNAVSHLNLAHRHGFGYENTGLPIIIADGVTGRDAVSVKIDLTHLKEAKVASGLLDFDYIVGLAHLTGHCQTGLAAAIKNIGMGCASRAGKLQQHSSVLPEVTKDKCIGCGLCLKWCPVQAIILSDKKAAISKDDCIGCGECTVACRVGAIEIKWNESTMNLQQKMAEYAYATLLGKKKAFFNFLIKITKDCDCMAKDDPRIMSDIGILASKDPLAIDKASIDLLIKKGGCDKLKEGYPNIDWNMQLDYGSKIGLGNLDYNLHTLKG